MLKKSKSPKYWVVPGNVGYALFSIPLIALILSDVVVDWVAPGVVHIDTGIPLIIVIIPILYTIILLLFDPVCGRFSIDENGITVYTVFRTSRIQWKDVVDCGSAMDITRYCYIYFSSRILNQREKKWFSIKSRLDRKHIAFFLYTEEIIKKVIPMLPPEIAEKISYHERKIQYEIAEAERKTEEREKRQWGEK